MVLLDENFYGLYLSPEYYPVSFPIIPTASHNNSVCLVWNNCFSANI